MKVQEMSYLNVTSINAEDAGEEEGILLIFVDQYVGETVDNTYKK